jgi:hypothetical protein
VQVMFIFCDAVNICAAAIGGNVEDCSSLINFGADVNWKGPDGDTPLLSACRRNHFETIALLLAHGASPNIVGKDSMGPLHIAARRGDHALINVLLDTGIDPNLRTGDGYSALDIARSKGYEDISVMLMNRMTNDSPDAPPRPRPYLDTTLTNPTRPVPTRTLPTLVSPRNIVENSDRTVTITKFNEFPPQTLAPILSSQSEKVRPDHVKLEEKNSANSSNSSQKSKYALISNSSISQPGNKSSPPIFDETSIALQNLLGQEQRERKVLENKVE